MLFRDEADIGATFERILAKHGPVSDEQRLAVAEWVAHEHVRAGRNLGAAKLYARAAVTFRSPGNALAAVGALGGRRGLQLVSRMLVATRGVTHLNEATSSAAPAAPSWLTERARRR